MSIRVSQLPDRPPYGVLLKCAVCHGEYSATKGDYFLVNPNKVMACCRRPLALVRKRTVYETVFEPVAQT